MLFRLLSRFKFLLKSTNQHGVHSPFVFYFVTKGLYRKTEKSKVLNQISRVNYLSTKKSKILHKITTYFNIDTLRFDTSNFDMNLNDKYQLLFIKNIDVLSELHFSKLGANHIILIDDIHKSKKKYDSWIKICQNKKVTVSIDIFHFGLLFFKRKQAKEHFTIRV